MKKRSIIKCKHRTKQDNWERNPKRHKIPQNANDSQDHRKQLQHENNSSRQNDK